jgi:molybdenum cofactor cytidylyltransferase
VSSGFAPIFDPEPTSGWGFRGDPFVWRALAVHLGTVERPPSTHDAIAIVHTAFRELVGVGFNDGPGTQSIFRPEFDGGGMTGGQVSMMAWRTDLMPLLEQRLRSSDGD